MQRAADKHFCVSKITGVRGKQAASDGTLPWFSFSNCQEAWWGWGVTEEKLKEERERRVSRRKEWKEREGLGKMNYAKLSEAAIVGGAGCVKGIQC